MALCEIGAAACNPETRPPFECIALLLQGGGALGAYQAGVYEALSEANLHPDWVVSIGAINSAIIAAIHPSSASQSCARFGSKLRQIRCSTGPLQPTSLGRDSLTWAKQRCVSGDLGHWLLVDA